MPDSTPFSVAPPKFTVAVSVSSYALLFAAAPLIVRFFAVMFAVRPLGCETV